MTAVLVCPIWFIVSLLKNAIEGSNWRLALARIVTPVLTFWLLWTNNTIQIQVAEANALRVVAALETYHAANGKFPKKLDELVPQYFNSVPVAKYCFGPWGRFTYINSGNPIFFWHVIPPYGRKTYDFENRRWGYLD